MYVCMSVCMAPRWFHARIRKALLLLYINITILRNLPLFILGEVAPKPIKELWPRRIFTGFKMTFTGNIVPELSPPASMCNSSNSAFSLTAGDDWLVCEILSRLPMKSLMRCKCVCNRWQSLIQKDPYFVGLHFTQSKTCTSVLVETHSSGNERCWLSAELRVPSEDGQEGGAKFQREISLLPQHDGLLEVINFLNGLICFKKLHSQSVCVYNPSTGESTPSVKSAEKRNGIFPVIPWYHFGYDPATMEHKVLAMWYIKDVTISDGYVCEVYTVGKQHNVWRTIADASPAPPHRLGQSVSINGSIFWFYCDEYQEPCIVDFNIRSERFRIILLPNFISQDTIWPYRAKVMQVGGRLAVLAIKVRPLNKNVYYDFCTENNDATMKMCVLYGCDGVNDGQESVDTSSSGSSSSNHYWMEETFSTPPFDWQPTWSDSLLPIPGTDLFIIKCADDFSFYYYNWKKRSYSSSKVEIEGVSSLIMPRVEEFHKDYTVRDFFFFTSIESLLPVNQLIPCVCPS